MKPEADGPALRNLYIRYLPTDTSRSLPARGHGAGKHHEDYEKWEPYYSSRVRVSATYQSMP